MATKAEPNTSNRSSLTRSISVGLLATPLTGAATVGPDAPVRAARRLLEDQNFDQGPVLDEQGPIGYVLTRDLKTARGTVRTCLRTILPDAIAASATPLEEVLPWLHSSGFLFLLDGREVTGFVVPSDLNKQDGRSYFYLGLVELELWLADLVRRIAEEVDPLTCLDGRAATGIRSRLKKHTEANIEADVVAEMYIGDLFEVAGTCSDLPELVEADTDWRSYWLPIRQLRNRIAHAAKPVLGGQSDLGSLLHTDQNVHALIAALPPYGPAAFRITSP